MRKKDKYRLTLEFNNPSIKEDIESIAKILGSPSKSEIFRRSILLTKEILLKIQEGSDVVVRKKDGQETKILFF